MVDEQGLYFYPYSNICRTQKIPGKYYLMIINKKYPENRSEGCADHAGDPGVRIAGSVSPTPGEHHLPERPVTGLSGEQAGYDRKSHHTVRFTPGLPEISACTRVFNHNPVG
jgi:hypothetical protein